MKLIMFAFLSLCASCFCKSDDDVICTQEFRYGLSVLLKDANTNANISEGLTVTITDGSYQEVLINDPGSDIFIGAGERAGNYIITVTSDNYQTYTSEVITIDEDECHVITRSVEILMEPN